MAIESDETHDPQRRSWIDSANDPQTDFPIQNLPFGVFRRCGSAESARVGVAIGNFVLDLALCSRSGLFQGEAAVAGQACTQHSLNGLLALSRQHWLELRRRISMLLHEECTELQRRDPVRAGWLIPRDEIELLLPARIRNYTDFYASIFHATNVGSMFRPDSPLLPNYKYVPIAYHGRPATLVVSGTPVRRPWGQVQDQAGQPPCYRPTGFLDYELEVGILVGTGSTHGETVPIGRAAELIFGYCLVNDWSARDIQRWEYQPLGPFLAKNFATSVSPWIVTAEALAPFRCPGFRRPPGDPPPMPHLFDEADAEQGGIDLQLEVYLCSEQMRAAGQAPQKLSRGSTRELYWTPAQMIAHHCSNGCSLEPGDLIATGTVSGAAPDSQGCLLELTWRGEKPVSLPSGEVRRQLEDGDDLMIKGWCLRPGFARIGFGACCGQILPAAALRQPESPRPGR